MSWYNYGWRPYVPVAVRRQRAKQKMESLRKKGVDIQPVEIQGRKIATTFWGQAWCDHLESFSDYENRLPRGRTYVRNGSVCHLAIARGTIEAKVSGSELYTIRIAIKTLSPKKWKAVKQRCSGKIGSLIELLRGRLSDHVMEAVTDRKEGLFPLPGEISFDCSCPDWATMCKHVAAVLYGVGARLDQKPELLFLLRGVSHDELIEADAEAAVDRATSSAKAGRSKRLAVGELSDVFGIDLDPGGVEEPSPRKSRTKAAARKGTAKTAKTEPKKKATKKKAAKKSGKKTSAAAKPAKRAVKKKPAKATAKKRNARKPAKRS